MKLYFQLNKALTFTSIKVGAKAANLAKAQAAGICVPPSYVLLSCKLREKNIKRIKECLNSIINANDFYAIRSSASIEDMDKHSAAGIFDSFIAIKGVDSVFEAIINCYKSFDSKVARKYTNISRNKIGGGIIIQKLINAKRSGVIVIGRPMENYIMVEGVWGIAIPLVSGMVDPAFLISKINDLEKIQINNSNQNIICVPACSGNGTVFEKFENKKLFFDEILIEKLVDLSKRIINIFNQQYEIEWAEDYDGRVWLIQARPVVSKTLFKNMAL